jgi:hypothetical protein
MSGETQPGTISSVSLKMEYDIGVREYGFISQDSYRQAGDHAPFM